MHKYIITGGPGSGKSTLLQQLAAQGYNCVPEASRQIIREQVLLNTNCLPWVNLTCFAVKVAERITALYHENEHAGGITFFDRGMPDIVAYLNKAGLAVPESYTTALSNCVYSKKVFLLSPWPEIYTRDDERWQTFNEAVLLYRSIKITYQLLGYRLISVPQTTVYERAAFVISNLMC